MTKSDTGPSRASVTAVSGMGILIGIVVAVLTVDVILGVIAGASFVAITVGALRLWYGGTTHPRHP